MMRPEPISKVEINTQGELCVYLESGGKSMYQHIYRQGRQVCWDQRLKAFQAPRPRKWSYSDWFSHIISVTNDVGIQLEVTPRTQWLNTPKIL
ncbi:hypothetical protein [Kangiella taiwanensis]|nr:hypothetical protein [Kangiella taiwanensis]